MSHPNSMIMVRVGNREYPVRSVPQCKTCQSPYRQQVESLLLVAGRGFAAIARELPEGANLSAENLADHYNNGHLPIAIDTRLRIEEKRAEQVGKQIESADTLVDQVVLANMVIQRTAERLASGEIEPEVSDGLNAAKFIQQVEKEMGESIDHEMWVSAINAILGEAEGLLPHDLWMEFGKRLGRNPVLHALRAKQEEQATVQIAS